MNSMKRRSRSDAERRTLGGRTLVAIIATAALTLGPGAMSAFADDTAPPVEVTAPAVESAQVVDPVAPDPPVPEPPAPAPVPEQEAPVAPPAELPTETSDASDPGDDTSVESLAPQQSLTETVPSTEAVNNGDGNPQVQIDICHATGAEGHWVMVPANANGTVSGHAGMDHQDGRDIIPPFDYQDDGVTKHFPGQNWGEEGQAIYYNGCEEMPPSPQNPVVEVSVDGCVIPWKEIAAEVTINVSGLMEDFEYTLEVTGPGYDYLTPVSPAGDGTAQVTLYIYGAGDYVATVTGMQSSPGFKTEEPSPPVTVSGSQEFTVTECPKPPKPENPVVEVSVDQCVPPNGVVPSGVDITVTKLDHRFDYWMEVTGPEGFFDEMEVLPDENGSFSVELPVPGPGDYTVIVTGTRGGHEWPDDVAVEVPVSANVEAQFANGSEGPHYGGKHTLTGMAEFTVNPDCAVTPPPRPAITPAVHIAAPPAMLAETGSSDQGTLPIAAFLLLLGLGSALLAPRARRALRTRR